MSRGAALLPAFVAYEETEYTPGDDAPFRDLALPAALDRAVPARKTEFLAGRACARRALVRLFPEHAAHAIPIGTDRAPSWPPGVVGAITHAHGLAAAAVARASDALGVGLDVERVVPAEMLDPMLERIALRAELDALLAKTRMDERALMTLVFSAKESIYKCIHPRVGRYVDFQEVLMLDVAPSSGTFTGVLRADLALPELPRGAHLTGRFALDGDLVRTA